MGTSPNTDHYTLGKGIVYFNRTDAITGLPTGERDLGNAPAFTYNIALTKLPHYSSRGGLKAKDKEIVSEMTPALAFTLDEITSDNLALLLLADVEVVSQTGATVVDELGVAYLGKRIALDYRGISVVSITNPDKVDVALINGVDYEIDTSLNDDKIGRILFLDTADAARLEDGDNVEVSYTYATVSYTKVKAFAQTQVEGFLRFVSDNPAGLQQELQIWRVSLTPTGDTAMIGEDWSTLGFTGEILKDEVNHPESPYYDLILD